MRNSSAPRDALAATIDASSNNITTSFGSGAGSKILTGIKNAQHMRVESTCNAALAIAYKAKEGSVPSSAQAYIAAAPTSGTVIEYFDDIEVGAAIYIRSDSGGTISSGKVKVSVW